MEIDSKSAFSIDAGGEQVVCARTIESSPYVPGRLIAYAKFTDGTAFVSTRNEIKAVRKVLQAMVSKAALLRWSKRLKVLNRRQRSAQPLCAAGPPVDPPPPPDSPTETPTAAPTSTPTASPTMSPTATNSPAPTATQPPPPVASNLSATANGLAPLALTFSIEPGFAGAELHCELVSAPQKISVEVFPNCTALVTPGDHRVGSQEFQFKARRTSDGIESNTATVSVAWTQEGSFLGDKLSIAPYKDALAEDEVRHLMRSAAFGANMEEAIAIGTQAGGLDALVEHLLSPSAEGCEGEEQQAAAMANYEMNVWCYYDGGPGRGFSFCTPNTVEGRIQWSAAAGATYWLHMMRYGCEPLRERIGLLWNNHFAINQATFAGSQNSRHNFIKAHLDLLRSKIPEAEGKLFLNFADLLSRMHGKDGAMLYWLDNRVNTFSGGGNENYARELLELFSMGLTDPVTGAVTYDEQHVYDMRFALMGYGDRAVNDQTYNICCDPGDGQDDTPGQIACAALPVEQRCQVRMRQNYETYFDDVRWNHPNQPVRTMLFLGTPWQRYDLWKANTFDAGEDNLTPYLLNDVPAVSRYIAARLIASFSSIDLTEKMVQAVADTLLETNYDIKQALKQILTSSSFYAPENLHDGVMNPIESAVSFLRGQDLPLGRVTNGSGTAVYNLYTAIKTGFLNGGQGILELPTVFGTQEIGKITGGKIHDGKAFISVQRWLERWRSLVTYLNTLNGAIPNGIGYSWQNLLPGGEDNRNPDKVLTHVLNRAGITISDQKRDLLRTYLTTVVTRTISENGVLVPDPNFTFTLNWQLLTDQQFTSLWNQKGPGLMTILYSLPEVHTR